MKNFTLILIVSSVLMACSNNDNPPPMMEEPLRNELEMSFIGTDEDDKLYGYRESLSSVECRYDQANSSIRVVAYKFSNGQQLKVAESLQVTDVAIETSKSGFLKPAEGDMVPSFIFLSDQVDIKYTEQSNCSTYYEIQGDEIRGNILCSALETDQMDKTFVSLKFQCLNQNYLLFEIKQEML